MSDQDAASFQVVDKRTGSNTENDAQNTTPELNETDDNLDLAGGGADTSEAPEQQRSLPDPGFLLNMAAVQMDASSLIQSLIPVFDQYAWSALGFIADVKTGETAKDLPNAQLSIDTVQFLLSKIEAHLSDTERRDLQRRLSDLKMNYLAKLRE